MKLQETNTRIADFVAAIQKGKDAFEEAGRILVELIDSDPDVTTRITEGHPEISPDLMAAFERIGRRQLHPELIVADSPGARALSRCPYSEQAKYLSNPLPMLLVNSRDQTEHLQVELHALHPEQVKQVFGTNRVRSLAEQRTYLEKLKAKPRPIRNHDPYTCSRGRVTFHEPVVLSRSDLLNILKELEQS